ncbi:MAG: signal transduction histidine kinase [Crocinitomicaceae bacterium]
MGNSCAFSYLALPHLCDCYSMDSKDSEIILIFASAAGILLLFAAVVVIFVVVHQKRVMAQEARVQKIEVDYQKELLIATIEGQERERKRLAKELHDGIGSLLTGLNLNLKHQLHLVEPSTNQSKFLTQACAMLEEGIVDVRRVSHNLLPVTLQNFGLLQALKEWIEPLQHENRFAISLMKDGEFNRPGIDVELGILRVIQELLHNTIRHANASQATIEFTFDQQFISVIYTDNGRGIGGDVQPNGIGIKNMKSRAQALDGTFEFDLERETGFKAQLNVPIKT